MKFSFLKINFKKTLQFQLLEHHFPSFYFLKYLLIYLNQLNANLILKAQYQLTLN